MWLMGHYVPVPSDTGWTDGDLEDRYITSRYRVLVSKEQYDRTVAYIRQLQAKSTTWSVELYNCNAFVADIANFMGLRVPSSSWIYPKVFVSNMRKINTGHPEAANALLKQRRNLSDLLADAYMLGRNRNSNGCVSIKTMTHSCRLISSARPSDSP